MALYYMIPDSSVAINNWQLTTGESTHDWRGSDLPHTRALTHGRRRHSRSSAQLCCISVMAVSCGHLALLLNLGWTRLTANDRSKASAAAATGSPRCHQMQRRWTHLIFQSRCVTSAHEAYRYRHQLRANMCRYRLKMMYSFYWSPSVNRRIGLKLNSDLQSVYMQLYCTYMYVLLLMLNSVQWR